MKRFAVSLCLIFAALIIGNSVVIAEEGKEEQGKPMVFGWELMSPEERAEHRKQMHSFATVEEKDNYRRQHHQRMVERAKERGVTLPEPPSGMATLE